MSLQYNLPKRRPYEHPGRLFVERHGVPGDVDGIVKYANFLRHKAHAGKYSRVRLSAIRWRFGVRLTIETLPPDTPGFSQHEQGLICVRREDPRERQRFTEAHEFIELLYRACKESPAWMESVFATNKHRKEKLCHKGAAALLMPRESYLRYLRNAGVSLQLASSLAELFRTSLTSSVHRMVDLSSTDCAMLLWDGLSQPRRSEKYSGSQPDVLHLRWAVCSPGIGYIPPAVSVDTNSLIGQALTTPGIHKGKEEVNLGGISGECLIEAKRVTLAGQQCVLSLVQPSP